MSQKSFLPCLILLLVATVLAGACQTTSLTPQPVQPIGDLPTGSDGFGWWNDTVFYEIFVRSFYDSDGNGIGDINGVIQKLDYLNDGDPDTHTDLGVTGLWLMPIYPSPSYHGYDVTNYYGVNSDYGSLDDLKRLVEEAHRRDIRVILDLVLNHTSSQHPWFQAALDPASPQRNWYIWQASPPGYKGPWGEDVWHASDSGYYYGIFEDFMPDLNYTNPEVVSEMGKVTAFWLQEVGVDGFRLDAAEHIIEDGQAQENTPANHDWWKNFHTIYTAVNPQALSVGELIAPNDILASYTQGDQFDLVFNFDLSEAVIKTVSQGNARAIKDNLARGQDLLKPGVFATILSNHDRNRVSDQLLRRAERVRLAGSLLFTLPGVPFVYYGEEIGMTGSKPDERIRAPMLWSAEANGGFSSGTPWEPLNLDYKETNVATQTGNPDALLSHYRNLIQLRNAHAALRVGDYLAVECNKSVVLAFFRASQAETLLVITNLGRDPIGAYGLSAAASPLSAALKPAVLLADGDFGENPVVASPKLDAQGGFSAYKPLESLPGNSTLIIQWQADK